MLQTIGLRMRSHRSVRDYPFVKADLRGADRTCGQ